MKKPLARVLIALSVLVAALVGAAWWMAANHAKQAVQDTIARINATPLANGSTLHITYAGIETTGLPPAITVRLVDPVLDMTLPPKAAFPIAEGESVAPQPTMLQWAVKGAVDIGTHYLGASYTLLIHGDDTLTLANKTESVAVKGAGNRYHFTLKAKSFGDFLAWEKLDPKDEEQVSGFLRTVAEASSDIGPLSYVDAESGEPAITQSKGQLRFVNRSDEKAFDVDIELLVKDAQVYPAYGKKLAQFDIANPSFAQLGLSADQMPFSNAGKQSADVAFSAYVARGDGQEERLVRVNAPRFSIRNDYYDLAMPFGLDILKRVSETEFRIKADTRMTLTEKGGEETRKFQDMIARLLPMMAAGKQGFTPETFAALKDAVVEALPNVSQASPLIFTLDVSGKTVKGTGQGKGKADLAWFEFSNTHWGLKANGNLDALSGDTPAVNLTLACEKCTALVDESVKTLGQWQHAARLANPERPAYPLDAALAQAVVRFLESIGKKDGETLTFTVTTPAPNDVRIGEQPLAAVMMQAMATLAPYTQPVAPEAPAKAK